MTAALTAVPPSANRFPVGLAAVPHTVPRELSAAPPLSVTVAPNVALLAVIEADVGVVTVGTTGASDTSTRSTSQRLPDFIPIFTYLAAALFTATLYWE